MTRILILIATFLLGTNAQAIKINSPLVAGIPSGYYWLSSIWLNDAAGDSLTDRFVQVVIVNGEADVPDSEGNLQDDMTDRISGERYNKPEVQELFATRHKGFIDVQFTVYSDSVNATNDKVEFGEKVLVRLYDARDPKDATHYRQTEVWTTEPGLHQWFQLDDLFGDWIELNKTTELESTKSIN